MTAFPRNATLVGVALLLAGCAGARLSGPVGEAVPDPAGFAASLREATLPATPEQITFSWTLNEQGSNVGGRGVVRTEAAERIRLDLFGPRGETYLIAALVGDEYRLPPEAANADDLPSPALLWGALGVLQPPAGAQLTSATSTPTSAELRYELTNGEVYVYTFDRGPDERYRLSLLQRASSRGVIERVTVEHGGDGAISRAGYRDNTAFRELSLEVESVRPEQRFPSDIWSPDAAAR